MLCIIHVLICVRLQVIAYFRLVLPPLFRCGIFILMEGSEDDILTPSQFPIIHCTSTLPWPATSPSHRDKSALRFQR